MGQRGGCHVAYVFAADPKPPEAALVKSHGGERCGKVGTMIPAGARHSLPKRDVRAMSVLPLIATEEPTSQDVSNVPGAETFTSFAQGRARSAETICVTIGEILEHLRPPNAPTISETQAMPNPKSIML